MDKVLIHLKLAAQDVEERATIAYYTREKFHKEMLADSVKRLEREIATYKKAVEIYK